MAAIAHATVDDLSSILALLDRSGLPHDGLSDQLATTIVARAEGMVVGSAALEIYGAAALLRSVAVEQRMRGQGLGQRLTRAALELAQQQGMTHVYLLTETAADFYLRFGFRTIERSQVPVAVQGSVEFASVCPASATVMVAELG